MSSDGFFEDGSEFDADALAELDALEATQYSDPKPPRPKPASPTLDLTGDTSFDDLTFDISDSELASIDAAIARSYQHHPQKTVQTTLFGDTLPPQASTSSKPPSTLRRTGSSFGQPQPQRTKQWDHTEFAKTGLKPKKGKGRSKKGFVDEDGTFDDEQMEFEFEQFPNPEVNDLYVSTCLKILKDCSNTAVKPPPMRLEADLLEAKHWFYPLNRPKRDYQYNIVRHSLFDNTIVALPTGLGKTFVAGVVMLNYYRWFPKGKVVFLAPTKPLVAQQISACHQVCGIPGSDAAELTGEIQAATRNRMWQEKRVFYMTPQTLVFDLLKDNCDPLDIVLIVIDEAHRATGNYAYNQVIRFMMAKNPHFRILALTATPGSTPEAVQTLVDGLHISRIEIRNEGSLDLQQYVHEKKIEQHIIQMNEDVLRIKDLFVKLLDPPFKAVHNKVLHGGSPHVENLHPFRAQALMPTLRGDQRWAFAHLSKLSTFARILGYLIEGTIGMCYSAMKNLQDAETGEGSATSKAKNGKKHKYRDDPAFQAIMVELEVQKARGFGFHPKMTKLREVILGHFIDDATDSPDGQSNTRVMVFVTFREAVDEIVEVLNVEPSIRAHRFIGQGTDKQGKKGLGQKQQLEVIEQFKRGEFNVLVATSVGEEGLDIGEVDLIVCYDAQKTPIRMLQRMGRAGRKRAGVSHVLLAEGREEHNLEKAKAAYKEVQKTIIAGDKIELYGDVERLIPSHIKPECVERVMDIQEYIREIKHKEPPKTTGKKRKRNDDIMRNIPAGASTGFVSVANLMVKKRKKSLPAKSFDSAGESDEDDKNIEAGPLDLLRRTVSDSSKPQTKKKTTTLKKAKTHNPSTTKPISKKRQSKAKATEKITSSQLDLRGQDDEDDEDIERGLFGALSRSRSPSPLPISPEPDNPEPEPDHFNHAKRFSDAIDISDTDEEVEDCAGNERHISPQADLSQAEGNSMAWLVDDDDDVSADFEIIDSSPHAPHIPLPSSNIPRPNFTSARNLMQSTEIDESLEIVDDENDDPFKDESVMILDNNPGSSIPTAGWDSRAMPPPALPPHVAAPPPTFPVGRSGKKRKLQLPQSPSSEDPVMPPPSKRRIRRKGDSPTGARAKCKGRGKARVATELGGNMFALEAQHSGDEVSEGSLHPSDDEESEGSSHPSDDEESESDRRFLEELPETQMSQSYDQDMAYQAGLLSQAPAEMGLAFARKPVRHGALGLAGGREYSNRRRPGVSSSPPRDDNSEPDEYQFGSFVVDDSAEILYEGDDDSLDVDF